MKTPRTLSIILMTILATVALAACSADPSPTPAPTATATASPFIDVMVTQGQPFEMGPNYRAFVDADGYTIDYVGVASDSRCARDVQCITAGRAVVEFAITPGTGQPTQSYLFGIGDNGPEPSIHDVGGFRVSLTNLDPQPHSDGRLLDYRATLIVTEIVR